MILLLSYMTKYIIGIGTNLHNRKDNIEKAIDILSRQISIIRMSSLYESPALSTKEMPRTWQRKYYNMVIEIQYWNHPSNLLIHLKNIEVRMGRNLKAPRFFPRIIDLDILLSSKVVPMTRFLQIPHKELYNRDFTLVPIKEILSEDANQYRHLIMTQKLDLNKISRL